jgi:amino acid transporter
VSQAETEDAATDLPAPVAPQTASPAPVGVAGGHGVRDRLTVVDGLAALSLDAMASVAYGPEAIVLVLAAAGGAGLGLTLPVTLAIAVLLAVLVLSYRQVIAAFPNGGGAYAVARRHLTPRASLVAAASLVVDYVLNVAVSVAAGVAALTSAFPALLAYTVQLCLVVLLLITLVNLRGIASSARTFVLPTVVFVGSIFAVIIVGLLRDNPAATTTATAAAGPVQAVGVLLVLRAFANGCAALTGVEAVANAVPSFREPAVRRAQRTELALGGLLGVMLIGLAVLIERFDIRPVEGVTVLAQLTDASLGHGVVFYVVQIATTVLLALAANTSFGGLPVLAKLLATDNYLPHVFALRARRQVYRYGVLVLSMLSAVLLVAADGQMNVLVPLFAIGVFVGFTIAQVGMVRHWRVTRGRGWQPKAALNGTGAVLTGVATVVTAASKFGEGGWLIMVALPVLVAGFEWVHRAYARIGSSLQIGRVPAAPYPGRSVVVVPVGGVSELTRLSLDAALSLGDDVVAVHVGYDDEPEVADGLREQWEAWHPEVPLTMITSYDRDLGRPFADFLRSDVGDRHVFVLIADVEPAHWWERMLRNNRGNVLERAVRRNTPAVVCRMRFPVGSSR